MAAVLRKINREVKIGLETDLAAGCVAGRDLSSGLGCMIKRGGLDRFNEGRYCKLTTEI